MLREHSLTLRFHSRDCGVILIAVVIVFVFFMASMTLMVGYLYFATPTFSSCNLQHALSMRYEMQKVIEGW